MKKVILLFTLVLFVVSFVSFGKKVEIPDAKLVGKNFYFERINDLQQVSYEELEIVDEFVVSENGIPLYYVFNFSGKGFIIVTADDALYPVIGYSFNTLWTDAEQPPHFRSWMENYETQIRSVIEGNIPPNEDIIRSWSRLSTSDPNLLDLGPLEDVEPLVTSLWNQDFPNNGMCPQDPASGGSYNGRVPVGCVATAMTQIMHYWRYPTTGQGSHCIFPQPSYGPQCADFGASTYDWDAMQNNMSKECDPVALISWHAGIAVDMDYGPGGSGANMSKVAPALINYFKYANTAMKANRENYSATSWSNLIKADLDLSRPLEYSGQDTDGGHAWVCDGYQGDDMFHMNWGWGGSSNGYYLLTALNPGGSNFNQWQTVIYHIEPNPAYYPTQCSGQTDLTGYDFGSFADGSGPVEKYDHDANCSWLIAPNDSAESITLTFITFETEPGDFVNVYDGSSASAPLLGSFEGTTLPSSVSSTGPTMFVTFTSNSSANADGFLAEYTADLAPFCASSLTLTDQTGNISDGSESFNYRNSTICKWYVKPTDAETVTFTFDYFNTEEDVDKVQIYDLGSQSLVALYSGNYSTPPPAVTCNSGEAMIMWSTNKTIRGEGWNGSYTITVGTQESAAVDRLHIYPNPASGVLHVVFDVDQMQTVHLELISLTGVSVYTESLNQFKGQYHSTIGVSGITKGIYILRLTSEEGVSNTKVMVQ